MKKHNPFSEPKNLAAVYLLFFIYQYQGNKKFESISNQDFIFLSTWQMNILRLNRKGIKKYFEKSSRKKDKWKLFIRCDS